MHTIRTFPMALLALAALATSAGAGRAEDYVCHSLTGEFEGDPGVEISFTLDGDAVSKAAFQIEGDLGYSTEATEPTALATVTGLTIENDFIAFKWHYTADGYDGDVAEIHIVTLSEGAHWITGGAFHAEGGGLYVVRCENPE